MFTVASRFRRLKFVGSYLSTIEAVGTGSWLSVVQVLLDVSIALLVAIIEFHGGIHRGYRTISSEFFFVKRYMQRDLNKSRNSRRRGAELGEKKKSRPEGAKLYKFSVQKVQY